MNANQVYELLLTCRPEGASPIEERDAVMLTRDIEGKLIQGWTSTEIVRYLKNTEEVNPVIEEHVALANMKHVKESVDARLGINGWVRSTVIVADPDVFSQPSM